MVFNYTTHCHTYPNTEINESMALNLQLLELQQEASNLLLNYPIITVLCFLFVSIFLAKTCLFTKQNGKLPPSPPKLPILGNLHQLGHHPHRSLHSLSRQHGSLMLLHLGSHPTLVVSSADAAREIMKTHDTIFSNRPQSSITTRLFYGSIDLVTSPYGEYWRQIRSISVLHLFSAKRVWSFRAIREEETALMINKILQQTSRPDHTNVDLSEMFVLLANDVVCRVAFGRKYSEGEVGRKFKKLLHEFAELLGVIDVGDIIPWLSWLKYVTGLHRKVERVFKEFDQFLDRVIDDHKVGTEENDQMDFVDVLLKVQEDGSDGVSLGRDNIKALLLDAFAGGTNTTFTALEWTMTEVLRHPHVLKEAQKEIRGIVGGNAIVTEADIEKMHYLKAVIKESLRMHPPFIFVVRESSKDVDIQGYYIRAKTRVIINVWSIGRGEASWEEADEFRPERFVESSIDFKGNDFEMIPFGGGRRGCPGTAFSIATIEMVLASLLHKFDWALPPGDVDMTETIGSSVRKKLPLLAVPIPHSF